MPLYATTSSSKGVRSRLAPLLSRDAANSPCSVGHNIFGLLKIVEGRFTDKTSQDTVALSVPVNNGIYRNHMSVLRISRDFVWSA